MIRLKSSAAKKLVRYLLGLDHLLGCLGFEAHGSFRLGQCSQVGSCEGAKRGLKNAGWQMVGASTRWCHRSDDSPAIYASCEVNESHPHGDAWLKDRSPEKCLECGKVLPRVLQFHSTGILGTFVFGIGLIHSISALTCLCMPHARSESDLDVKLWRTCFLAMHYFRARVVSTFLPF